MEWISVKDRLPKKDGEYFCYTKLHYISVYYYGKIDDESDRKCFYFFDSEYGDVEANNVTHWMELPEPPKGE